VECGLALASTSALCPERDVENDELGSFSDKFRLRCVNEVMMLCWSHFSDWLFLQSAVPQLTAGAWILD